MGRKKLCPNALRVREQERKETFTKRCKGLFKKAHELASMCGCTLQLVVNGEDGRVYEMHRLRNPQLDLLPVNAKRLSTSSPFNSIQPSFAKKKMFYNKDTRKMEYTGDDVDPLANCAFEDNTSAPCRCSDCISGRSRCIDNFQEPTALINYKEPTALIDYIPSTHDGGQLELLQSAIPPTFFEGEEGGAMVPVPPETSPESDTLYFSGPTSDSSTLDFSPELSPFSKDIASNIKAEAVEPFDQFYLPYPDAWETLEGQPYFNY